MDENWQPRRVFNAGGYYLMKNNILYQLLNKKGTENEKQQDMGYNAQGVCPLLLW